MAQPPILVLGASSLVGRFALPRLQAAGLAFNAVSRHPEPGWIQADIEPGAARGPRPPATTVLSFSPIWLLPDLIPTLKAGGMDRLIAFSSTSVLTKAGSANPAERAVVSALEAGEAAVRDSGAGWTILRPTLIYAEGRDGNVSRLASLARRFGVLPIAGSGAGLRQPVHGDDLAAAALSALDAPPSVGRTYELAGGETLSYRQMCEHVFEGLERRPRILSLPAPLWRLGLMLASPLLPGANAQMGERMDRDLTFGDAAARADLGWSPRPFRPRF